jgi:hypothetical protein
MRLSAVPGEGPTLADWYEEWERQARERVARAVRCIHAPALAPRRWPERGDKVVPIPAVRRQVGWKGSLYPVRVARAADSHHDPRFAGMYDFCCGCNAPIETGTLYAQRPGCRPLCIDCVQLPEGER